MKKFKYLRKRTVMEGTVAGVAVAVVLGIMVAVSGMMESAEQDRRKMQTKVQAANREATKSKERLQSAGASMALYDALKKEREEMSLVLNRREMTQLLTDLKMKYRLSSLNLQVSPEQPYEDDELRAMKLAVVSADVRLDFGGISDQHLFAFIQDVRRQCPGFIRIQELSLNRNKLFDIEAMRQISQGAKMEMVSGSLAFTWFGYPESTEQAQAQP